MDACHKTEHWIGKSPFRLEEGTPLWATVPEKAIWETHSRGTHSREQLEHRAAAKKKHQRGKPKCHERRNRLRCLLSNCLQTESWAAQQLQHDHTCSDVSLHSILKGFPRPGLLSYSLPPRSESPCGEILKPNCIRWKLISLEYLCHSQRVCHSLCSFKSYRPQYSWTGFSDSPKA